MRSSVFLLFLCSLSVHASQYYAANGSVYDLGACYSECIVELAKEDPSSIRNTISLAEDRYQEGITTRVFNHFYDNKNYQSFEDLYKIAPVNSNWVENKYKSAKLNNHLQNYEDEEKLSAALNYLQVNKLVIEDNYYMQEEIMALVNEKRNNKALTSHEKIVLKELNDSKQINFAEMIQNTLYYNEEPMDDIFNILPFKEKSEAICQTVEELNATFDEYYTEDCYDANECIEVVDDHTKKMKNIYKSYLTYSCNGSTVLDEIKLARENNLDFIKEVFVDELATNEVDECYDCGVKQYGDYIADTRVIKEADKFFKITKMWTEGCHEDETYASFYNMERRAIKSLRKYERLNITDAATKSDKCKIRIDAVNYKK